jgi:hypothetical protein
VGCLKHGLTIENIVSRVIIIKYAYTKLVLLKQEDDHHDDGGSKHL